MAFILNKEEVLSYILLILFGILCGLIIAIVFIFFSLYNDEVVEKKYKVEEIKIEKVRDKPYDVVHVESFGSSKILNSCWKKEELLGSIKDKKIIIDKSNPDHSPPDKLYSETKLLPLDLKYSNSIRSVTLRNTNRKLIALTFDLCEKSTEITGYDAEIVNFLRENKVKSTFYAGGKWMRSHPNKAKQLIADPLFEVGNHGWTHGNMRVLTGQEMKSQVFWTQAQYEILRDEIKNDLNSCGVSPAEVDKIPKVPLTFRYPYGTCSAEALGFLKDYGLPSVQWNIVTADPWKKQTAEKIVDTVIKRARPGSIIIAHANGRGWYTSKALPKIVSILRSKGYEFVTVTELLASAEKVNAYPTCFELKPRDNLKYDQQVGNGTE